MCIRDSCSSDEETCAVDEEEEYMDEANTEDVVSAAWDDDFDGLIIPIVELAEAEFTALEGVLVLATKARPLSESDVLVLEAGGLVLKGADINEVAALLEVESALDVAAAELCTFADGEVLTLMSADDIRVLEVAAAELCTFVNGEILKLMPADDIWVLD